MITYDPAILAQIVADAKAKAAAHPRWLVAIDRAVVELETNPYLEWQDGHLLILSESGTIYAANGVCQCRAFQFKNPCWHRACARLVRLYQEAHAPSKHIAEQARDAYKAAALPASRRPLFAERDAETMRRAALSEERAQLEELRADRVLRQRAAAAAMEELFS